MSGALAEALVAAQRRAIAALQKQYAAGKFNGEQMRAFMDTMGVTDKIDQEHLLSALDVIIMYGAPLPAEPTTSINEPKAPERATEAQLGLIARLVKEKNVTGPEVPLTKEQAHEVIDTLKSGTYDQGKWVIPF